MPASVRSSFFPLVGRVREVHEPRGLQLPQRESVALLAQRAFHLLQVGGLAVVADDDRDLALLNRTGPGASVPAPGLLADAAPALDILLKILLGLQIWDLLQAAVEEVVLPLPEAALREGLHVPLDATSAVENSVRAELFLLFPNLVHQSSCSLASDASSAVHHNFFSFQLLLGLRSIEPSGKLEAVPDRWNDQLRTTLWRLKMADGRLVAVPNINDDSIRISHHFVVVVSLQVCGRIL
mmetsp:Transcript_150844/g.484786  ORF Transcript_150844/g.484786 Transcript_150844/m.484786 type:complete len:239 (+) Transcript_150844:403-1119(+)